MMSRIEILWFDTWDKIMFSKIFREWPFGKNTEVILERYGISEKERLHYTSEHEWTWGLSMVEKPDEKHVESLPWLKTSLRKLSQHNLCEKMSN